MQSAKAKQRNYKILKLLFQALFMTRTEARLTLFALFLITISLGFAGCQKRVQYPRAEKGVLDLSGWDFAVNNAVPLDGEWEFYWNRLLSPEDFEEGQSPEKADYFRFPGIWRGKTTEGTPLSPRGYATYRLVIKHQPNYDIKSLHISNALSSCRVWIDGRFAGSTGRVGKSEDEEDPRTFSMVANFRLTGHSTEIVLQVSNFHNIQGAMGAPIWLGDKEIISDRIQNRLILTTLLGGMFLIIGLHHLLSYSMRRADRENLYFGIYCLVWVAGYVSGNGGGQLMNSIFPALPWRLSIDLFLLSYAVSIPLIIMFYHSLFPRKRSPIIKYFYQVLSIIFIAYVLATPPNGYGFYTWIYINLSFGVIPYLAYQFIVDVIRKEAGARLLIPGYLMMALSAINDKLNDFNIIDTTSLTPIGGTIFLLSYSLMISIRSSRAHSAVESLSGELKAKNIELKKSIRTLEENIRLKAELHQQKQKEELLKIESEKSMLEKLRYQLNPHFLFNALNSIRAAIRRDAEAAHNMVSYLSEFCRLTLSSGKEEWLEVRQEVQQVELYLKIEQSRLKGYLDTSVAIDPAIEKNRIPTFILQPLIENALRYGKLTSSDHLNIKISAEKHDDRLVFKVTNTGEWIEPGSNPRLRSTGIGLDNLNKRLEKLYRRDYSLSTSSDSGVVIVSLELPDKASPKS